MHTIKVELTLNECDALEQQLLEIASELGKPLNFCLLRIEEKGKALLTGYFKDKAQAQSQLKLLTLPAPVQHGFLRDRDWQDSVKKHFKPLVYRHVAWVPSWQKKLPKAKVVLRLDPGMAFGTGNHPTTRLCLRRVVEVMERYRRPSVMDIGCGSGILAITAKKLGASRAEGFDLDEHSITVAKRNAQLNRTRTPFAVRDLYRTRLPQSDIVLANLLFNLIADNSSKLIRAVSPGGTLILSGLLKDEVKKAAALFRYPSRCYTLGKWGAVVITKE
jgi:ribosomal protein L11 methyltransferase